MRTAIYCRVSGARPEGRHRRLPEQERIGREKAAALGWAVSEAHVYREVMRRRRPVPARNGPASGKRSAAPRD